jgi:hypothetical protein
VRRFNLEIVRHLRERGALPGLLCPDLRDNRVPAEVIAKLRTRSPATRAGLAGFI